MLRHILRIAAQFHDGDDAILGDLNPSHIFARCVGATRTKNRSGKHKPTDPSLPHTIFGRHVSPDSAEVGGIRDNNDKIAFSSIAATPFPSLSALPGVKFSWSRPEIRRISITANRNDGGPDAMLRLTGIGMNETAAECIREH